MDNNNELKPRCLKIKAAAKYIAKSVWKLRNLTQAGRIRYIPGDGPTSPWTYDIKALDEYIEKSQIIFPQF